MMHISLKKSMNKFLKIITLIPCYPKITTLVWSVIFFKIDERSLILLWKGVKYFCCDFPKTIQKRSGRFRPPLAHFLFLFQMKPFLGGILFRDLHS
eukprot:UN02444